MDKQGGQESDERSKRERLEYTVGGEAIAKNFVWRISELLDEGARMNAGVESEMKVNREASR